MWIFFLLYNSSFIYGTCLLIWFNCGCGLTVDRNGFNNLELKLQSE